MRCADALITVEERTIFLIQVKSVTETINLNIYVPANTIESYFVLNLGFVTVSEVRKLRHADLVASSTPRRIVVGILVS